MMNDENFKRDEQFLKNRIEELLKYTEKKLVNKFTAFLTEKEQETAAQIIHKYNAESRCIFFGGHERAERKALGVFVESIEKAEFHTKHFPVRAITYTYSAFSEKDKLSHRNILGTIMSCGIKREMTGDIITGNVNSNDYAIVFHLENVHDILFNEVKKIGRVGVKPISGIIQDYPLPETKFDVIKDTVSSLRLDSVISVATGLSRSKSLELIKSSAVKIKGSEVYDSSRKIEEMVSFTIKGYGKFLLSEIGSISKKGRIHIKLKKYK